MLNTRNIIIILTVLSLAIHLVPFLAFSPHPLGYDTGFYRRYVAQTFESFPNAPVPGLGKDALGPRIFLDLIRLSGLSPDIALYASYIFLFIMQPVALFFLTTYFWGRAAGTMAAILFIFSPVQYTAYWFMLFKNALALPLMLAAFLLLEKGSRFTLPLGILIAFSHHTTSIIFLLTLIVFAALNREKRNLALQTFAGTFLTFLYLHSFFLQEYLNSPVAIFMGRKEYLILSLPLLIVALFGIKEFTFRKPFSVIAAFSVVTIAFPLFSLPFYERIFIFTDAVAVITAALGFKKISSGLSSRHEAVIQLLSGFFIFILSAWLLINTYGRIKNLQPLVSASEIEEFENILASIPKNAAILTSTPLAPWIQGWSQNRVFAPGMLYDAHTTQEWVLFLAGSQEEKIEFLKSFPRPLYIFLSSPEKEDFFANFQGCAEQKSAYLFKYTCN